MHTTGPNRLRRLALALGAVFTVLFVGVGTASPAAATGHGDKTHTVRVALVNGAPVFGDPTDPQPGDVLLFEEPAVDPNSGQPIGDSLTRIQVLKDGSYLLDCTVRLGKGNLMFTGGEEFQNMATKSTFAVVGGTGHFSGTGGQVDITPTTINGQEASLLVFQLRH